MANNSHIFGFRPLRDMNSSPYNGLTQVYVFAAAETTLAFKGDLVQFDATNRSSGIVDPYVPGVPAIKAVVAPLTTTSFRGVIAGFVPQPEYNMLTTASLGTMFRQASTLRYGWVVDDYTVVFEAEETGNGFTSATANAVNKNIDIAYTAGSQLTGISAVVVDAATVVTNAVKPFQVLRYSQRVDNFNFVAADTNSRAHYELKIQNSDLAMGLNGA